MTTVTPELQELFRSITPKWSKYIPHSPFAKQAAFLLLDCDEALYGGQAGGGKSDALLMGALQYMDVPGYNAALFRRTYADLAKPSALMDRAHEWLKGTSARWIDTEKKWRFTEGSTLSFGYMETDRDKYNWQSAEIQYCGFDELTQFLDSQYTYLFSRLRRLATAQVPLRMRSASNPGGVGHEWVKKRFITDRHPQRRFVRAGLRENTFVDTIAYTEMLNKLDPLTRAQLRDGDWNATSENSLFPRSWFREHMIDIFPQNLQSVCRYWDLASTKKKKADYTAGSLVGVTRNGLVIIANVKRAQASPHEVETLLQTTANEDGWWTPIVVEIEPGSAGKLLFDNYARTVLSGFAVYPDKPTGSKISRMLPLSSRAQQGHVYVVKGPWNDGLFDEGELLTRTLLPGQVEPVDDQWDSCSGGYNFLTHNKIRGMAHHVTPSQNVVLYAR